MEHFQRLIHQYTQKGRGMQVQAVVEETNKASGYTAQTPSSNFRQ